MRAENELKKSNLSPKLSIMIPNTPQVTPDSSPVISPVDYILQSPRTPGVIEKDPRSPIGLSAGGLSRLIDDFTDLSYAQRHQLSCERAFNAGQDAMMRWCYDRIAELFPHWFTLTGEIKNEVWETIEKVNIPNYPFATITVTEQPSLEMLNKLQIDEKHRYILIKNSQDETYFAYKPKEQQLKPLELKSDNALRKDIENLSFLNESASLKQDGKKITKDILQLFSLDINTLIKEFNKTPEGKLPANERILGSLTVVVSQSMESLKDKTLFRNMFSMFYIYPDNRQIGLLKKFSTELTIETILKYIKERKQAIEKFIASAKNIRQNTQEPDKFKKDDEYKTLLCTMAEEDIFLEQDSLIDLFTFYTNSSKKWILDPNNETLYRKVLEKIFFVELQFQNGAIDTEERKNRLLQAYHAFVNLLSEPLPETIMKQYHIICDEIENALQFDTIPSAELLKNEYISKTLNTFESLRLNKEGYISSKPILKKNEIIEEISKEKEISNKIFSFKKDIQRKTSINFKFPDIKNIQELAEKSDLEIHEIICKVLPKDIADILFLHYQQELLSILRNMIEFKRTKVDAHKDLTLKQSTFDDFFLKDNSLYLRQTLSDIYFFDTSCLDGEQEEKIYTNEKATILFQLTKEGFLLKQIQLSKGAKIIKELLNHNLSPLDYKKEEPAALKNYIEYLTTIQTEQNPIDNIIKKLLTDVQNYSNKKNESLALDKQYTSCLISPEIEIEKWKIYIQPKKHNGNLEWTLIDPSGKIQEGKISPEDIKMLASLEKITIDDLDDLHPKLLKILSEKNLIYKKTLIYDEKYDCDKILKDVKTKSSEKNNYLLQAALYHKLKTVNESLKEIIGNKAYLEKTFSTWLEIMLSKQPELEIRQKIFDAFIENHDKLYPLFTTHSPLSRKQLTDILDLLPPIDKETAEDRALQKIDIQTAIAPNQDDPHTKKFKDKSEELIKKILEASAKNDPLQVTYGLLELGGLMREKYPHLMGSEDINKKELNLNIACHTQLSTSSEIDLFTLPYSVYDAATYKARNETENHSGRLLNQIIQYGWYTLKAFLGIHNRKTKFLEGSEKEGKECMDAIDQIPKNNIKQIIYPVLKTHQLYKSLNEILNNIKSYAKNVDSNIIQTTIKNINEVSIRFFLSTELEPFLNICENSFNSFGNEIKIDKTDLIWQRLQAQLILAIGSIVEEFDIPLKEQQSNLIEINNASISNNLITRLKKEGKFPVLQSLEKQYKTDLESPKNPFLKQINTDLDRIRHEITALSSTKSNNAVNKIRRQYLREYKKKLNNILTSDKFSSLLEPLTSQESIPVLKTCGTLQELYSPENVKEHASYENERNFLLEELEKLEEQLVSNPSNPSVTKKQNTETMPLLQNAVSPEAKTLPKSIATVKEEIQKIPPLKISDNIDNFKIKIWAILEKNKITEQLKNNTSPEARDVKSVIASFHPALSEIIEKPVPPVPPTTLSRVRLWSGGISIVGFGLTLLVGILEALFGYTLWMAFTPDFFAIVYTVAIIPPLFIAVASLAIWTIAKIKTPKPIVEIPEVDPLNDEPDNDKDHEPENKEMLGYLTKLSETSELYVDIADGSVIYKDTDSANMHYFNPMGTVPPKNITEKYPKIIMDNQLNLVKTLPSNAIAWLIYIYANKNMPENLNLETFNIRIEARKLIQQPISIEPPKNSENIIIEIPQNNFTVSSQETIIEIPKDNFKVSEVIGLEKNDEVKPKDIIIEMGTGDLQTPNDMEPSMIDISELQKENKKTILLSQSKDTLFATQQNEKKILLSQTLEENSDEIVFELEPTQNKL